MALRSLQTPSLPPPLRQRRLLTRMTQARMILQTRRGSFTRAFHRLSYKHAHHSFLSRVHHPSLSRVNHTFLSHIHFSTHKRAYRTRLSHIHRCALKLRAPQLLSCLVLRAARWCSLAHPGVTTPVLTTHLCRISALWDTLTDDDPYADAPPQPLPKPKLDLRVLHVGVRAAPLSCRRPIIPRATSIRP